MVKQELNVNFSTAGLLKVVGIGLFLFFLYKITNLILIILTAIVIASFVESASNKLKNRFKFPRTLSVGIIYIMLFFVMAGVFYLFVPILIKESLMLLNALAGYFPELFNGANSAFQDVTDLGQLSQIMNSLQSFSSEISNGFFATLTGIFGGILNFILIIVISFYLSMQERGIERFLEIVVPAKHESYVIDLWRRTQRKISLWIRGQMILGLIVGVITYIALLIAGVQYALIFAILTAVMELIPYGVLLAAIPAVSVGFSDGGLVLGLVVAGIFLFIQQMENYFLQPLVLKRSIGISPIIVIIAVIAGAQLAGFWGIILAIPVTVAILEYFGDLEQKKVHPRDVVSG